MSPPQHAKHLATLASALAEYTKRPIGAGPDLRSPNRGLDMWKCIESKKKKPLRNQGSVGWETRMTSYTHVLRPSGHFRLRRKCSLSAVLPKVSNLLLVRSSLQQQNKK